jgi:hypothetical protein
VNFGYRWNVERQQRVDCSRTRPLTAHSPICPVYLLDPTLVTRNCTAARSSNDRVAVGARPRADPPAADRVLRLFYAEHVEGSVQVRKLVEGLAEAERGQTFVAAESQRRGPAR